MIDKTFIDKNIKGYKNPVYKLLTYLEIPIDKKLVKEQASFDAIFFQILSDYPKYDKEFFYKNKRRRMLLKVINKILPIETTKHTPYIIQKLFKSVFRQIGRAHV